MLDSKYKINAIPRSTSSIESMKPSVFYSKPTEFVVREAYNDLREDLSLIHI